MTIRQIGLALGPLVFALTALSAPPAGMSGEAWLVAGLVVWMAAWWMTEAVPMRFPTVTAPALFAMMRRRLCRHRRRRSHAQVPESQIP